MKRIICYAFAAIVLISGTGLLSSFSAKPAKAITFARWEKLGERKVNYAVDRDEISVGAYEGFFDALQVRVRRSPINMTKMTVHFGNGESKEIELRDNIGAGGQSRVIDLPGNNRIITRIVFWYDTKNNANKKAIVEVWGRH